jgi:hypothetical protein
MSLPLNEFQIGTEIGSVIDLVLEELRVLLDIVLIEDGGERLTIPVTLLPMKFAGWLTLSSSMRK